MNNDFLSESQITWDLDYDTADLLSQSSYGRLDTNSHVIRDWTSVVYQLLEWRQDPSQLLDEDYVPPTVEIIELAIRVARWAGKLKKNSPLNVVPDGDGGVAFERREGTLFETILITSSAEVEILAFQDAKLIHEEVHKGDTFLPAYNDRESSHASALQRVHTGDTLLSTGGYGFSGEVALNGEDLTQSSLGYREAA